MSDELHLLIDDLRNVGQDLTARNSVDGKHYLQNCPITHLYIDHDLGLDENGVEYENGYKVICWAIEHNVLPPRVQIVSANPVGKQNIEMALKHDVGYVYYRGYWISPEIQEEIWGDM